ncbi:MAG: hypothetical protein Q9166_004123 [cf. Caloplaca sp. 2 TL-2023]
MAAVSTEKPGAEVEEEIQNQAAPLTFDSGYGWLLPGATPLDFAFVGGLEFAVAIMVAPLVKYIARVFGTLPSMLFGAMALAGGFVLASFAATTWQLYLSHGALVGFGVGFTYIPGIPIISQWFAKKRSLANGVTSAGSEVGGIVFSIATHGIVEHISLGWSLRITGIMAFVLNALAVVLIKDRNKVIKPT